jgi:apolipoprotein N-acyltransferase
MDQNMATKQMPLQSESTSDTQPQPGSSPELSKRRKGDNLSVQEIIATARQTQSQPRMPMRGTWFLGALSGLLFWASFTPLDWGPVAWLALAPICLLAKIPHRTRWMYSTLFVTSLIQWLAIFQWMRLGDAMMYPAWILWCVYLGFYLPTFVALSRTAVLRFRVPSVVAIPLIWVALEYARAHIFTGAAWYFLAHTQYQWLEMIQISDITGAYGVSFVIAMMSAGLAGLLPAKWLQKLRLLPQQTEETTAEISAKNRRRQILAVAFCMTIFATVLGYGYIRRSQADFQPGPRIALIQGNFTTSLKTDPRQAGQIKILHETLTGQTVLHQPDLIVWPETMFRYPLMQIEENLSDEKVAELAKGNPTDVRRYSKDVHQALSRMSQQAGTALMIGIDTTELTADGRHRYNSAAFVTPKHGVKGRYDKMHLVVYGEYMPFAETTKYFIPNLPDPGLTHGKSASVFTYRNWRFSPVICFEDTVPHLVRRVVKATAKADPQGRPVDCLVNMTNDGWFHGSSELDQHLITAVFRSVECRTPMVRAVNTGVSAVIDGDGAIVEPEVFIDGDGQGRNSMRDPETGRWHKSLNSAIVHTVPLDNRRSLYVQWGDWFAGGCALFAMGIFLASIVLRRKKTDAGRELFLKTVAEKA